MNASVNVIKKDSKLATPVQSSIPKTELSTLPIKLSTLLPVYTQQVEFKQFLSTLKTASVRGHWQEIAIALGIDPEKILDWLKLPEATQAKQEGIRLALEGMESAGFDDWKMYQTKLRMLNVKMNDAGAEGGGNVTNNTLIVLADAVKGILSK
jgi:hypothetical protein